jgi:hypothetical protein
MLAYNVIYLVAHWYAKARDTFDIYVTKPCKQLKQLLIDDTAIEHASLIQLEKDRVYEDVLINLRWFNYLTRYLQMLYYRNDWTIKKRLDQFVVSDLRLDHGAILYVRLANGKEFLTDKSFYSSKFSNFSPPNKKYLCILLGKLDISVFIRRFWTSWNNLNIDFNHFIILTKHLDHNIKFYCDLNKNTCNSLTLVDDDDFSESYISNNDRVQF